MGNLRFHLCTVWVKHCLILYQIWLVYNLKINYSLLKKTSMRCNKCQNDAVFSRKYSGEELCSPCFSNSILRKTAKTISKFNMIRNNELVCVAVSGGKDSLVLLHILDKMSKSHNFRIKVVTIDEGIPTYRNEALEIVKKFCAKLNVDYSVYSYDDLFSITLDEAINVRENEKISSCSICGTLRRRALDYAAKDIGANIILLLIILTIHFKHFSSICFLGISKKLDGWIQTHQIILSEK